MHKYNLRGPTNKKRKQTGPPLSPTEPERKQGSKKLNLSKQASLKEESKSTVENFLNFNKGRADFIEHLKKYEIGLIVDLTYNGTFYSSKRK
jgi:hypothetical protein